MIGRIKDVMLRKIWRIPLVLLLLMLLGVTIVTGAIMYSLVIPGSITVELPAEGDYEVKVYWDAELTNEVTFFDFGTVKFDTAYNITFYIKSLSSVPCEVFLIQPSASGLHWTHFYNTAFGRFAPGEVKEVTLFYEVDNSSEGGTLDFDMTFDVYPSE